MNVLLLAVKLGGDAPPNVKFGGALAPLPPVPTPIMQCTLKLQMITFFHHQIHFQVLLHGHLILVCTGKQHAQMILNAMYIKSYNMSPFSVVKCCLKELRRSKDQTAEQ